MKKSIAVDIGNVSVAIKVEHFAQALQLSEEEFAFCRELQKEFEWGHFNEEVYWARLSEYLPRHSVADIQAAFDGILQAPIPGTEQLLALLESKGYQPAYFSDVSPRHLNDFKQFCKYSQRYPGIYSFEVGAWKPSEAMFSAFEKQFGVPALYIDDRATLIEAACKRGWNAVQFITADKILTEVVPNL